MTKRTLFCVLGLLILLLTAVPAALGASSPEGVTFGDQSWDSVQFHHRLMGYLLEHGYGIHPEYSFSETMPALVGLERGQNHLILEVWTEARQEWWDKTRKEGKVRGFGKVFPKAPSGLYVPTYLTKGDEKRGIKALAPDLKSVLDLPQYKELFKDPEDPSKGRVYNAVSGWKANEQYEKKFKGYIVKGEPLEKSFNLFDPGSQTALATAIKGAYTKGKPIVAYYWEPTPLLGELDMILLEEPSYDKEIYNTTSLCANPAFSVEKAGNVQWIEKHSQVMPLLERYSFDMNSMNRILMWMQQHQNDPEKAALWFLKNHEEIWRGWIEDGAIQEKIEKALAKEL